MSRPIRAQARPVARRHGLTSSVENLETRRLFAVSYTVTDLAPDTDGVHHDGYALGVSNNGKVALHYDGHAAYWDSGVVHDLGFFGYASDVNDNGVVCGAGEGGKPFVYANGTLTLIPLPAGATSGVANAVNANGVVAGTFYFANNVTSGFTKTLDGEVKDLGAPAGVTRVQATGINDSGQVVGNLQLASGANRAFIKSGGTFKTITSLPGGEASYIRHGLTNTGTLAVDGPSGDNVPGSVVKAERVFTVGSNGYATPVGRGTYGQAPTVVAQDINAGGAIVADTGEGAREERFAVRSTGQGNAFELLDSLVNAQLGWHFEDARGINDSGAIVGNGNNGDGSPSPFLLTPIPVHTAKINGRVFNDADNDGTRDSGEGNLSGVTVTISRNGVALNTFVTGVSGEFGFTGLEAGTYTLSQTVLSGYAATAPGTGTFTVTVADGQVVGDRFFGQHKTETPVEKYQIRGKVWNDTDNDGVFDENEVVSGVRTVFIDANRNGKLDSGEKSTQSRENGEYVFEGLANGEYPVARVLPSGYHLTNGTNGKPYVVVNVNGATVLGVNLGSAANVEPVKTASITGIVFNDTDKDGLFDDNEERSGVRTVFIDTNGNKKLDDGEKSVQSNAEGRYTFAGLAAGTYRITRVFPSGYKLSNNNDGFVTITVAAGQVKTGVNLGSRTV